jgi:translation initiation factor 2 subunit 2
MADVDAPPASATEEEDLAAMFDLSLKKKKKKKKETGPKGGDADDAPGSGEGRNADTSGEASGKSSSGASSSGSKGGLVSAGVPIDPPPYNYTQLLDRVIDLLHHKDPDWTEKRRAQVQPPQLVRVGTKKTMWTNFPQIIKTMHRSPEHVFQFVMTELSTDGSIDGNGRLIIKGKFTAGQIQALLKKYIMEYVSCQMCRSFNTKLSREPQSRLYFVECEDCKSSKSVSAIRAGYHATTKADRKAERNK